MGFRSRLEGKKVYAERDSQGRFSDIVGIGPSLQADRRQHAKRTVKPGYGHQGDQKRRTKNRLFKKGMRVKDYHAPRGYHTRMVTVSPGRRFFSALFTRPNQKSIVSRDTQAKTWEAPSGYFVGSASATRNGLTATFFKRLKDLGR